MTFPLTCVFHGAVAVAVVCATILMVQAPQTPAEAQQIGAADAAPSTILITNARIFDGTAPTLIEGQDVLIRDCLIAELGAELDAPEGAIVIDAAGRVMTPDFIDMHYHLSLCNVRVADMAGA